MTPVVLVTGGAAGIGRAIADAVVTDGARAILWDVDAQRLDKAQTDLGDKVRIARVDVSDTDAVDAASGELCGDWAPTHLVNNAGIIGRRMTLAIGWSTWSMKRRSRLVSRPTSRPSRSVMGTPEMW